MTELANTPGYFSTFGPGRDERTFNFPEFNIGKISFVKNKSRVARGRVLSGSKFHGALFTPSAQLQVLSRLEVLCTEHIRGFTPGIEKIAEGNSIYYLSQNDSEFGLEQMRLLSKCRSMVGLDLQKNRGVTDECIAFAPANLENLTTSGCPVTPKCIPALAKLKRLKNLHISLNGWSNEDLQKLRHALPKAELNP